MIEKILLIKQRNEFLESMFELLELHVDTEFKIVKYVSENGVKEFFDKINQLNIRQEDIEKLEALKIIVQAKVNNYNEEGDD